MRSAAFPAAAFVLASIVVRSQQPPAAVPDPLVREGATVKLSVRAYVIPDNNVPLVPNVGIVVGSRATLVIDPGLGRRNGETVMREVAKVSKNTDLYIASTHFHAEHTTGYLGLPETAKYINSTIQEQEFAEGGAAQIKTFSGRSPGTAELLKDATGRKADITFDREYRLDLGGVHVRMLVVGPTHTRGDTGFFVEEDRVLFAGDVVMNNSFLAANQASSMNAWMAAFDTFEKLAPITIVPAHGAVGAGSLIAANRAVMQTIQLRARAAKASGQSADVAASTIQGDLVAKYPPWPRANGIGAAARSAYAEAP
jgi:glyoxylase-like metal-dependent hydrolase (beta-lactamase superfamily II)